MITSEPLLVTLVKLVDSIPVPPPPAKRPGVARKCIQTACFSRRW